MHIDSRPQPGPSAHKLSIFILIYGVHCWDIVAWEGKVEGGASLELVLSAAKTGIKTVFHFWRLSPKCHTKFVAAAAAQLHSNLPLPSPMLLLSHLAIFFSSASCPIHFVKLLPFKSETNDESKIYVKYVWQHFQKKAPAALPTSRPPALSLSLLW